MTFNKIHIYRKSIATFLACIMFLSSIHIQVFAQTYISPVGYRHTLLKNNINNTESDCVTLHFLGELLNFKYKRVGLVEVTNITSVPDELLLDFLKREAYKINANMIINVERKIVSRSFGFGDNIRYYDVAQYNGLAVYTEHDTVVDVCCTDMGFLKGLMLAKENT